MSDSLSEQRKAQIAQLQLHLAVLRGSLHSGSATTVLRSVPAAELRAQSLAYRPQQVKPDDARFVPYQGV